MGRLRVSGKLLLIYLLDLTAVIFITTILIEEKFIAIDFARKEQHGVTYILAVRDVLFATLKTKNPHDAKNISILRDHLKRTETEHGSAMKGDQLAQALDQKLSAWPVEPDPVQLRTVFQSGRQLLTHIGDQSNLILDPDLDSYYTMSLTILRFPELLEQLHDYHRLRVNPDKTHELLTKGRLTALMESIESDYRAAFESNSTEILSVRLDPTRHQLISALKTMLDNELRSAEKIETAYQEVLTSTLTAWDASSSALNHLLDARIQILFHRMWWHLGMAATLLIAILFLVFLVARQISYPIRRLAAVADQVQATNNYTLRASWESGDEIGQLVSGFNIMLERLDRERLIQQELASRARAAEAQRELLEAIPIPLLVTQTPDHHVLLANMPARAWVDAELKNPWGSGLERGTRARFFQRLADEGTLHGFEVLWNGPQGSSWALLSASRLIYQGQDAVVTTFTPINTIKRLEARLRLWATIFEATSEGILVLDMKNVIRLANAALARATGYRVDEIIGRDPEFVLPVFSTDAEAAVNLTALVVKKGSWQGECTLKQKNGHPVPYWMVLNTVRDEQSQPSHIIALFVDISERKAQEEKIRHLAHHDALTGLPNRLLFDERLRMSLQQADRHGERVGLLFIDLDRFKNINDSLGHHVGDGLLQSVAQRLLDAVRVGDTVCRQGGDEFVIILNSVEDVQEVAYVVERRLIPLILQTHEVCNVSLHISCSVGIAIYPDDADNIETLMRHADAAMYSAKTSGRNNFQFFSETMNRNAIERLNTETFLQHALENQELELHVQPIVTSTDGAVVSVEALLRWRHPEMGMIYPDKFIPLAEESGLIHDIGRWALEEACLLHQSWLTQGLGRIPIAVNVSAVQFRRGDFVETVAGILEEHDMPPAFLQLELTESLMMTESERNLVDIRRLKALGIGLSLDDFGTGFSSLSYLHRMPIAKLKVDRSFVRDMIEDAADMIVIRAIINLSKTLGLRVIAEGVEHIEEWMALRKLGCDEIQGYLFAEPMPGHELIAWYMEHQTHPLLSLSMADEISPNVAE
ncbi:MAG: EAL domain-containing protein [Magnetococcales bacterium]|nr:EAL domain-containing protein [Magnetococcales bacterium]